jgi:5-methylcytosine-specific restriction enzyme A
MRVPTSDTVPDVLEILDMCVRLADRGCDVSMRPLRPCAQPGCPALVRGSSRCPRHTVKQSDRRQQDPEQARFYGSRQWKALRAMVRRQQPTCGVCGKAPSEQVHHRSGDWRDNRMENLQGVCSPCHRRESGAAHRARQTGKV